MPDSRPSKRKPDLPQIRTTIGSYAELRCRSNYSFLEGASHPDELVNRAAELGLAALAITDRHSLAGVVRAHVAAKAAGLKLLIGAEITPTDSLPVVLLATDRNAYANLSQLITYGRRRSAKGECRLLVRDIECFSDGLLACVPLPIRANDDEVKKLHGYRACFSDRCYGLASLHHGPNDMLQLDRLAKLAKKVDLPLVASNDIHYHIADRHPLQEVLTAVRHGCTVSDLGEHRFPNAERCLKSAQQMQQLFIAMPDAITRTIEIADRCFFSLDELRYEYPEELCPRGMTLIAYLTSLVEEEGSKRYPNGIPSKVCDLIQHELALIEELHYEAYFLTVYDLVKFARSRGILCQGRGSAANSAVCFCLGITEVDPDRIDVLFERFISKERNEPPDIDVDFEHERREEVIQYIYKKYGRHRAAMTGTVITYRARSAMRDVGKALGFSPDYVDRIAKSVDYTVSEESLTEHITRTSASTATTQVELLTSLVRELLHFPRHLSQHPGGMVITQTGLADYVPIENAAMPERTVVQWDKDDLDALGLLKIDILALGMLSAIRRCFDLVEKHCGETWTLATVPEGDSATYDMICEADTIGVFQIESRAQMSMLPRLKPRKYYDLVIEVAIVRPGPIQGDMVHPYLRRRDGIEPTEYPDNRVREVLEKTLGVPIFQEQAMKLAMVAAGFTPGEADQLRRAMGAWRRRGVIDEFRQKLLDGMQRNGYDIEFAERLFRQLQGFGEYGFPESHAAGFALLAYVSSWLKCHYPAAFTTALLNSQPMGFYAPAQLVSDVRKHGVTVLQVDVNHSEWDCTLEPTSNDQHAVRLGFRMVKGLAKEAAQQLCTARLSGVFQSFEDLQQRAKLSSSVLARLSQADAFQSLRVDRRRALWNSLPEQTEKPLLDNSTASDVAVSLPTMTTSEHVTVDYHNVGLSLRGHPLQPYRRSLQEKGVIHASDLSSHERDRRVKVAGLVLCRQHPSSAKGTTFITLEDETGTINLIIRPDVWSRFDIIARTSSALIAHGLLQREHDVIHVLTDRLEDLSEAAHNLNHRSRDFR